MPGPFPEREAAPHFGPKFSGKRIKGGLYRAKDGRKINADINGSGNIIRKVTLNAFSEVEGVEDGKAVLASLVVHPVRLVVAPSRSQKASNSGSKRSIERYKMLCFLELYSRRTPWFCARFTGIAPAGAPSSFGRGPSLACGGMVADMQQQAFQREAVVHFCSCEAGTIRASLSLQRGRAYSRRGAGGLRGRGSRSARVRQPRSLLHSHCHIFHSRKLFIQMRRRGEPTCVWEATPADAAAIAAISNQEIVDRLTTPEANSYTVAIAPTWFDGQQLW